jgi:hypothetical protein
MWGLNNLVQLLLQTQTVERNIFLNGCFVSFKLSQLFGYVILTLILPPCLAPVYARNSLQCHILQNARTKGWSCFGKKDRRFRVARSGQNKIIRLRLCKTEQVQVISENLRKEGQHFFCLEIRFATFLPSQNDLTFKNTILYSNKQRGQVYKTFLDSLTFDNSDVIFITQEGKFVFCQSLFLKAACTEPDFNTGVFAPEQMQEGKYWIKIDCSHPIVYQAVLYLYTGSIERKFVQENLPKLIYCASILKGTQLYKLIELHVKENIRDYSTQKVVDLLAATRFEMQEVHQILIGYVTLQLGLEQNLKYPDILKALESHRLFLH